LAIDELDIRLYEFMSQERRAHVMSVLEEKVRERGDGGDTDEAGADECVELLQARWFARAPPRLPLPRVGMEVGVV